MNIKAIIVTTSRLEVKSLHSICERDINVDVLPIMSVPFSYDHEWHWIIKDGKLSGSSGKGSLLNIMTQNPTLPVMLYSSFLDFITALSTNNAESKELSEITDKDVLAVADIFWPGNDRTAIVKRSGIDFTLSVDSSTSTEYALDITLAFGRGIDNLVHYIRTPIEVYDFLRSKGYNIPNNYATQNITPTVGRELKEKDRAIWHLAGALRYLISAIDNTQGTAMVQGHHAYSNGRKLLEMYGNTENANQYSTPAAAVDWKEIEEEIFCIIYENMNPPMRQETAKKIADYLKHHFKPADKVGEWFNVDKGEVPEELQDVIFIVESENDKHNNGRRMGGRYQGIKSKGTPGEYHEFTTPGIGWAAKLWMPMPSPPQN